MDHVFSAPLELDTVYGSVSVEDPLVVELIESPAFQRLKQINQYGVVNYIVPTENYSRFEHSLGVYLLLQKAFVSRSEQIAGLLHDVSHTVFSHVGDYVFQDTPGGNAYQDDIHVWYLKESGLDLILKKHGLSAEEVDHKHPLFVALDQKLPQLCADRIEYNLQGGLLRGLISKEEFHQILRDLHYQNGVWFFNSAESGAKLGRCSLIMTETLWGAPWEALAYRWAADALRRAFQIDLVSFDEFHFSTDDLVWNRLVHSPDPVIQNSINKMLKVKTLFNLTEIGEEDLLLKLIFRGVDPQIQTPKGLKPLTQIDSNYANQYYLVKRTMDKGWPIKFLANQD